MCQITSQTAPFSICSSHHNLCVCVCVSLEEVDEKQQERALASALSDILWTAGDEQSATVALVTSECCFSPLLDYKPDNFTEKVLTPHHFMGLLSLLNKPKCDSFSVVNG